MRDKKIECMEDYYSEIENISELKSYINWSEFESLSNDVLLKLRVEIFTTTRNEYTKTTFYEFVNCNEVQYLNNYLSQRVVNTANYIMKAKYNELLYIISSSKNYCIEAISSYQDALKYSFTDTSKEFYELRVVELFQKILELTFKIKFNIDDLKKQYFDYLKNETVSDRLKTRLSLCVKELNIRLFKAQEAICLPDIFLNIAQKETDKQWREHNLILALYYANKIVNVPQKQIIYELLGNLEISKLNPFDENNLAIEHMNEPIFERAINYYKLAKCEVKMQDTQKLHSENKKKKRYIVIKSSTEVNSECAQIINNLFKEVTSYTSVIIMINLITCKNALFVPNKNLEEYLNNRPASFAEDCFDIVYEDINCNHKEVDKRESHKFEFYNISMKQNLEFIFNLIVDSINNKKLSYRLLYKLLKTKTLFGSELIKEIHSTKIPYTWLSMVDIGLESFFSQLKILAKGKNPDWRVSIDILTTKFEGILRDMIYLNGANITKLKDGNTTSILLEDILRMDKPDIKKAFYMNFDDDDLNLFLYSFSSKPHCLNIRNNVAHSFYLPHDYTIDKALIVFLSILRLAKFTPKIEEKK